MISEFARHVTQQRRAMGLTQTELAARIGCKQSALSMFERGHAHALARDKIAQLAQVLDLPLPAASAGSDAAPAGPCYCPLFDCPSNQLYLVQGTLLALPRPEQAGPGPFCGYCGERLESRCPGCGQAIRPGACCSTCGSPYIPTPAVETEAEARHILQQHPLGQQPFGAEAVRW